MTANNIKEVSNRDKKTLSAHDDVEYDSPDVVEGEKRLEEEEKETIATADYYVDQYRSIIAVTEKMITVIDDKCSGYTYKFDPIERPDLASAVRKVFGVTTNEITYDMYKEVIEEQIKINSTTGDEIFTQ